MGTFDSEMLACVQAQPTDTYASYNNGRDACANTATAKMSACALTCSGSDDKFLGWTPETEAGTAESNDAITTSAGLKQKFALLGEKNGKTPVDRKGSSGRERATYVLLA